MDVIYIYTITDPRNNLVFYVGRTKDPRQRFYAHLNTHQAKVSVPIKEIIEDGKKPLFNLIEECNNRNMDERELFWMQKYHSDGCKLYNRGFRNHLKTEKPLPYDIKVSDGVSFKIDSLISYVEKI